MSVYCRRAQWAEINKIVPTLGVKPVRRASQLDCASSATPVEFCNLAGTEIPEDFAKVLTKINARIFTVGNAP